MRGLISLTALIKYQAKITNSDSQLMSRFLNDIAKTHGIKQAYSVDNLYSFAIISERHSMPTNNNWLRVLL